MSTETIHLMFDGNLEECEVVIDKNGEYMCTAKDGRFVKFPQGADLEAAAVKHNKVNSSIPNKNRAPSVPTRIPQQVKKARALNLDTGQTFALGVKKNKYCHFFDTFPCGDYEIQLRLDWSDIDAEGNPTLDADFIFPGTTEFDKSMKTHPAHQTKREFDASAMKYLYDFEYAGTHLRLIVELTVGQNITGKSRIE